MRDRCHGADKHQQVRDLRSVRSWLTRSASWPP